VTELLSADASETEAQDTLSRVLPALRPGAADPAAASAVAHERWVSETVDRYLPDVARRFSVGLVLVSVVIGDTNGFACT
jgi:hypothetical protein